MKDDDIVIRIARDTDSDGVIALIGKCFSAYPGCVLDLPGLDADLPCVAKYFKDRDGLFWVAERAGRIVGTIGFTPIDEEALELKRLYVDPACRRLGLATRLLELVTDIAQDMRADRIDLWSDTRFREAHAFYLRHGFSMQDKTRSLNDPSGTTEVLFQRNITPF